MRIKLIPSLIVVAALIGIAVILTVFESEYLWKVQELNLFLNTRVSSGSRWWYLLACSLGWARFSHSFSTSLGWGPSCYAHGGHSLYGCQQERSAFHGSG